MSPAVLHTRPHDQGDIGEDERRPARAQPRHDRVPAAQLSRPEPAPPTNAHGAQSRGTLTIAQHHHQLSEVSHQAGDAQDGRGHADQGRAQFRPRIEAVIEGRGIHRVKCVRQVAASRLSAEFSSNIPTLQK